LSILGRIARSTALDGCSAKFSWQNRTSLALLTDTTLAAVFRAILAVFAILTSVAGVVAGAGREEVSNRIRVEHKGESDDLSERRKESGLSRGRFLREGIYRKPRKGCYCFTH